MTTLLFANQAQTTLAAPVNSTATTIYVAGGTASYFPDPGVDEAFKLTLVDALSSLIVEIVLVTAVDGDALTVVRGQEGTTPRSWKVGDFAVNLMTAGTGNAFAQIWDLENTKYSASLINLDTETGTIATLPTQANEIANKLYVDSVSQGKYKNECLCATTANITLTGLQTIDGYTTLAGDRVLVKNQTNQALNGIYNASTTAWSRSYDMNIWAQVPGALTFILNGSINALTGWASIAPETGTINVTPIVFTQVSGVGTYTAGTGLTLNGTQFSITNTGVTAASYGTADSVPTLQINAQGQVTTAVNTAISIAASQINSAIQNSGLAHSSVTIGSDSLSLGGTLTALHGVTIDAAQNTLSNIGNGSLTNSSVTYNGVTVALGGSGTIAAINPYALTIGTGLTGTSYDGSAAVTIAIGATGVVATNYGSAGSVGTFTVNAQGQITSASTVSIAISNTQVSGLGTMSTQNANNVNISGGTIQNVALTLDSLDNTPVGANVASTGKFTNFEAINSVKLDNYTGYVYANGSNVISASTTIPNTAITGLGTMSTQNANAVAITGGSIQGVALTIDSLDDTPIGATTANTIRGTTITATLGFYGSGANLTSIPNAALVNSSVTYNGVNVALGGSGTITAVNPNALTIGTGLSGASYNGSAAVTIAISSTGVVAGTYGTDARNMTLAVNAQGQITSIFDQPISIAPSQINATIPNSGLTNSSVTYNGVAVSLGGSGTITAANPNALTIGTGLSGTSYDGSSAVTIAIDSTVVTLTGSQILTNKTISGSNNTLSNIGNSSLTNSSVTIGSSSLSLGGTLTTLAGVTISGSTNTLSNIGNSSLTNSSVTVGTTTIALGASSLTLGGLTSVTVTQDPVAALDLATKQYVDNVAQGLDAKASCVYTTTGNITLSGLGTQAGGDWGSSLTSGDRILVKNQSSSQFNGIYVASASGWTRSLDMDVWSEVPSSFTFIEDGVSFADTGWVCISNKTGTIDVTPMTWVQFSGAGTYTAGTGLTLTGTQFSITNTAVTAAAYGSASSVGTFTVNAQGQLTLAGNTSIAIAASQITSGILGGVYGGTGVNNGSNTLTLSGSYTLNQSVASGASPTFAGTNFSSIPNGALLNSTISGISLGSNLATLTIGTSLSGTSYNGSGAITIALASTGVSANSYGSASAVATFTVNAQGQLTAASSTTISIAPSQINATIPNSGLTNSSVTINGNSVSLGGSTTITAVSPYALTIGTGLSGTSYDGSAAVTIAISNTTVTAASYGGASKTLTATVNAQGQLTALAETAIAIANTQVSGLGTMSTQNANSVAITGGTISGVSVSGYIPYTGASSAVDLNAQTLVNVAHLGIGTATVPTILLRAVGDNTAISRIAMRGYSSDANSSAIRVTKFRGTTGAPQAPQSGDSLGKFELAGYGTTSSDGYPQASYEGVATEAWGAIARGAKTLFKVTPNGTTTQAIALTLNQDSSAVFASSVTATLFSGSGASLTSIPNTALVNSSITINGSSVSLGGSVTVTATATAALTIGTGLSGTSYNGSTAVTIANTGVLSFSGGTTGLTPAIATTGAITLAGTLVVGNGGTGVATLTGLAYGNGTSAFTAATAAQVVSTIGSTAVTNATNAANVTLAAGSGATNYLIFAAAATGNAAEYTNTGLTYNSTNNAITGGISGGSF